MATAGFAVGAPTSDKFNDTSNEEQPLESSPISRLAPTSDKFNDTSNEEQLLNSSPISRLSAVPVGKRPRPWRPLAVPTLVVVITYCVLAGVYAFLAFLWFSGPDQKSWHSIVLSGWTARSVALCSLCIRWAVSMQAVLCTSILASSFLAKGAPISSILQLSTMRYLNSGPLDIAMLVTKKWRHSEMPLGLVALSSMLGCTTLLSQFSSTLLLSDLSAASIPTSFNMTTCSLGLVNDTFGHVWDYELPIYNDAFLSGQPSYPIFAESSRPEEAVKEPEIDDTGPVMRSFLPITADEGRADLLGFRGNATIYDARVACIRPEFPDLSLLSSSDLGSLSLVGTVRPVKSLGPTLILPPDGHPTAFNCSLPAVSTGIPGAVSFDQWFTSVCQIDTHAGGLLSAVDPAYNTSLHYYVIASDGTFNGRWSVREFENMTFLTWIPLGHPYLVFNLTNTTWYEVDSQTQTEIMWNATTDWQFDPHNQWVRITSSQIAGMLYTDYNGSLIPATASEVDRSIDVSICYDGFYDTKNILIEANRTGSTPEPAGLSGGIRQIGASLQRESLEDRGILRLSESELKHQFDIDRNTVVQNNSYYDQDSVATVNPFSVTLNFYRSWASTSMRGESVPNVSRVLFYQDPSLEDNLRGVSEERVDLFQEVLKTTKSPALALQALLHTVTADGFYKILPYSDVSSNYSASFAVSALQPVRSRGFFIVLSC
ncbi:hypothetical protein LTR47_007820 [Exophiala xenobiotica]|nr:hypothetical protein LTR41_005306 [Exophiala xenobiotica]KAK5221164.1 hypothetical protein LTR72_006724 [Exophiala xenobiotica]KAK5229218.1 hypothetical protein LTR47_007820 [Exophiala xenobiotica]KAK5248252.1 hypothetical protein LTS06_006684 [Exophiala xenobiotica]KAK5286042.1 hypothetical protein LTR14_010296 [Exophiala xenobiotica]